MDRLLSFNPCYCGCGLGSPQQLFGCLRYSTVSILVIVDVVWEDDKIKIRMKKFRSFNPCYCGCGLGSSIPSLTASLLFLFQSLLLWMWSGKQRFTFGVSVVYDVSILVIVDVVWEGCSNTCCQLSIDVSILVIVDVVWEAEPKL